MTRSLRWLLAVLGAALTAGAVVIAAPAAHAGAPRTPGVRLSTAAAEPGLTLGFSGADGQLASGNRAADAPWAAKARRDGGQIVRLTVYWNEVAPTSLPSGFDASSATSPDYDWTPVDAQVRELTAEGFTVLILVQSAPTWAEGPDVPSSVNPGTWEPNATDFGEFATAIATRYDGHTPDPLAVGSDLPKVSYWQAWNEPNLPSLITPQWVREGSTYVAESPTIYRNLENAFYSSVKAVSPSNFVIAAGTAPYGDPTPGGARIQPVTFDQDLLCLNAYDKKAAGCPGPTYFNAIDDHPYVSGLCCVGPTWHAALPDDTALADMYKVVDVLKDAERDKTVKPAGSKAVWATEIGWNTDPPNPYHSEASPPATVGRWATQALYVLWSQGVSTVLWFQLADDPAPSNPVDWDQTFTEGLYYVDGKAKPAAAALAFPFMTNRTNPSTVLAWGRAPEAGTLTVQERESGHWVAVLAFRVKADQVFELPVSLRGKASFRAHIGTLTSPVWSQAA